MSQPQGTEVKDPKPIGALQPAVEAVRAQLLAPERLRALAGAHRGWARVLAALLAAAELPDEAPRLPPDWAAQLLEALPEALRCRAVFHFFPSCTCALPPLLPQALGRSTLRHAEL